MVNLLIRDKAISYVGQREITGNKGFINPDFAELMKKRGHKTGEAWCSYFAELCVVKALEETGRKEEIEKVEKLFDGSALKTYNNFKASKYTVDLIPNVGAVAIWQNYKNGKPHWTGHVGIVIELHDTWFATIEGNSNKSGGREGVEVCPQKRFLIFKNTKLNQLVLKGFIHI